jgi:hypothetical protein
LQAGVSISAHDQYVSSWTETGVQPYIGFSDALKTQPDIVVISAGHRLYQQEESVDLLLSCDPLWVYDTIGLLSEAQIRKLREKHTVIVLGRGDL